MDGAAAVGGDRLLDRQPGDLVPEPQATSAASRCERDPPGAPLPRKLTQSQAKQIARLGVIVAVRADQQYRGVPYPAAQEAQQIDGRVISPVQVLDDPLRAAGRHR